MEIMKYPEVFITGKIDETADECVLCADALAGWSLCYFKKELPENFGVGMAAIGKKLDISPTKKNITEYAKSKGYL